MTQFDPITIAASAIISAFVSFAVSFSLAPSLVVRQERAARREESRRALAQLAAQERRNLARYLSRQGGARRNPGVAHGDDAESAAAVVRAAADLGPIRQRLVIRRCRLIYGLRNVEQALLYPAEDETDHRFVGAFFSQVRENGRDVDLTSHALHQAYSHDPSSRASRRLARHLQLLGHGL